MLAFDPLLPSIYSLVSAVPLVHRSLAHGQRSLEKSKTVSSEWSLRRTRTLFPLATSLHSRA